MQASPMTWLETTTSAPSSFDQGAQHLDAVLELGLRLPATSRTRTDVSIPKRGVMRLVAEGSDIESTPPPSERCAACRAGRSRCAGDAG